ncbi:MAG: hypothetical protein CMF19_03420 [Idiomarinaceae bacterium]|nr:hypothetical protein [Idiomarinaceae bacterium]
MEIKTPIHKDELDQCIYNWEKAIEEWQTAQMEAAEAEGMFKAWESATKAAIMATKVSAVMAEAQVRANPDWGERFIETQKLSIAAETKKRILRLAEAKWESERSRQVSLRNLR